MTGLAIVVYLNQHSPQPRERDYAYAASFYAFAIWIGLGVYALFELLSKKVNPGLSVWIVSGVSLLLVPGIMAKEGWDDHDRSNRYTALAMANNYLNSCAPNAILFTNGDNDTFPLWYAQEVEGIRTDVRVVNLSLLNTEWYIDQMKRKAYDSDPVPISLEWNEYKDGTRNYTYFIENENVKGYVELKQLFDIINTSPEKLTMQTRIGPLEYFPTKKVKISVDSAQIIKTGTLKPEEAENMVDEIAWTLKGSGITKNHLMVLDILAHNNWVRPIYFAITTGTSSYVGLEEYFQIEGMTYRLIPIQTKVRGGQIGKTATEAMYDHIMNKYRFGNMGDPDVYLDETNVRMTMNIRSNFSRLAEALIDEGKVDSARMAMDKCLDVLPDEVVPFDYFILPIAEGYYEIGDMDKGNEIFQTMISTFDEQLEYYFRFTGKWADTYNSDINQNMGMLQKITQTADKYKQTETKNRSKEVFDKFYDAYTAK
ncbi:MAG: hypothetical protein R2750_06375 [Bacteroidales bacterium]